MRRKTFDEARRVVEPFSQQVYKSTQFENNSGRWRKRTNIAAKIYRKETVNIRKTKQMRRKAFDETRRVIEPFSQQVYKSS